MIVVRRAQSREATRRQRDIDAMYRSLMSGHGAAGNGPRRVWRPAVEVYETTDTLEIVAEIAGMHGEDIDIVVEDDVVTIQGTRLDPVSCDHRIYHIARIGYGAFAAEVHIPFSVEADSATASYDNGFLRITLPRIKGRTIVPTHVGSQSETHNEQRDA